MIVVAGRVAVRPERRDEAIRAALAMAEATRREAGCVTYQFSVDLVDPNSIYVFEEWENDEALSRHFRTEHMRVFRAQLPGLLAGPSTIKRYTVATVSAMA